ncbi:hypothetical protein AgCh_029704 [Apium graveolens]
MATVAASIVVINILLLLISLHFILSPSSSSADAKYSGPDWSHNYTDWLQFGSMKPGGLKTGGSVRGSDSPKSPHGRK